jgi:glycosyltransferase involved in cell wall biosynthesis
LRDQSQAIIGVTDPIKFKADYETFRPAPDDKPPTVLQVLPALVSGGVERGTIEIAEALIAAGWRAMVVSSGGPMVRELERLGATHLERPIHSKSPLRWRQNINDLAAILNAHDVDIVHARSRMPAWIAYQASRRQKCPFVTTFHGRHPDLNPLKKLYNSILTRGDRVIAISHFVADDIANRYHFDVNKLRIIQRGVDLNLFDPDRVSAERLIKLAHEWRLPDGVPIIMLPARVTRWKGHELLIQALAALTDVSFRCLMVGNADDKAPFKAALQRQAENYGVADRVHFVGTWRDMPAAYKIADVVVSPTLIPEPFGRVVVEAQAMGRPVIASAHGGHLETIIDGKTGWLTPANDAAALSAALRHALNISADDRANMSAAAIAHAQKQFSSFDMCARTLAVYSEILTESTA